MPIFYKIVYLLPDTVRAALVQLDPSRQPHELKKVKTQNHFHGLGFCFCALVSDCLNEET